MTYEQKIEQLIADLRIDVAEALLTSPREDARMLVEIVNNATDFMQHQLTVLRVVERVISDNMMEQLIASAPTLRTEQAEIMAAADRERA